MFEWAKTSHRGRTCTTWRQHINTFTRIHNYILHRAHYKWRLSSLTFWDFQTSQHAFECFLSYVCTLLWWCSYSRPNWNNGVSVCASPWEPKAPLNTLRFSFSLFLALYDVTVSQYPKHTAQAVIIEEPPSCCLYLVFIRDSQSEEGLLKGRSKLVSDSWWTLGQHRSLR